MTGAAPDFRQIAPLALYELSSYGDAGLPDYWAGYLPGGSAGFGSTATLDQVWQDAGGTYLFLGRKPAGEPEFAVFRQELVELLERLSPTGDVRALWIADPTAPSGNWQLQLLRATARGSGPSIAWSVARPAQFTLGEYAVVMAAGAALTQADVGTLGYGIAVAADAVALVAPGTAFGAEPGSAWLPLAGPSVGAWRAQLTVPFTPDVDGLVQLGVAVRYGAPAVNGAVGDEVETLGMTVLQQRDTPISLWLAYDPLNPLAATRSRAGFFADDGSGTAPVLAATLRTSRGYETQLTPRTAPAPLRDARLVFCRTPLQVTEDRATAPFTYHLAPDGAFDVVVVPPKEAPANFDPTKERVMLGLSALEYAILPQGAGALAFFDASQPAYAPSAAPEAPAPAPTAPLLDGFATTAHATLVPATSGAGGLGYYAQPKQAPLFGGGSTIGAGFLDYAELPAAALPSWTSGSRMAPTTIPAAPFAGAASTAADLAKRIERTALAPARRAAVGVQAPPPRDETLATLAVTPQGLLVDVVADSIDRVVIANMPATAQQQLDFTAVGDELQSALQANELFFVVADPGVFMDDSSVRYRLDDKGLLLAGAAGVPKTVIDALRPIVDPGGVPVVYASETKFKDAVSGVAGQHVDTLLRIAGFLKAEMSKWTFQLSPRSWRTEEDGQPTLMLVKYSVRALEDVVRDPAAWSWQEAGALPKGGLKVTRDTLEAIFGAARKRADDPKAPPDDPYAAFYRNVVRDPSWTGVLFLNAPVSIAELPSELQFVNAGVDPDRFYAHHVGFSATPVHVSGVTPALQQTAGFGLIDYQDPTDLVLPGNVPFAFKTLSLTARFANAAIAGFSAGVELMVNQLFATPMTKLDPTHGNNLVLAGSYQEQAGTPSYAFALEGTNMYTTDGSMLDSVDVAGVRLLTATATGAAETVTTSFVLSGDLRFFEPPKFDPYCYGPTTLPDGTSIDGWLRFDGLAVTMRFPIAQPRDQTFAESLTGVRFDLTNSKPRQLSLARNFPVTLTAVVAAGAGQKPEDLGYGSVAAQLEQTPLEPPWFGLVYTLELGTLGALTGGKSLSLSLLGAWAPGKGEDDRPAFLALKLPGGRGTSVQWPLQGVLKLGFKNFQFDSFDTLTSRSYQLRLRQFGLSLLGLSFPPGNNELVLFGDPDSPDSKMLGWYAAYTGPDDSKPKQALAHAAHGPERQARAGRRALPPSGGI